MGGGDAAFSRDGSVVAVQTAGTQIRLFRSATLNEIATFDSPLGAPRSIAFSPDDQLLAAFVSQSLAVAIWDLPKIRAQLSEMNLDLEVP